MEWRGQRRPSWGCHTAGLTPRHTPPAHTLHRPTSPYGGDTPALSSDGGSPHVGGSADGPGGCPGSASPSEEQEQG